MTGSAASGAGKEAAHWPCLLELGCLLPHREISLILMGPEVPQSSDCLDRTFQWPPADEQAAGLQAAAIDRAGVLGIGLCLTHMLSLRCKYDAWLPASPHEDAACSRPA